MSKFFVTGGCGFIGSHIIDLLLSLNHEVVNLDALTYAGNKKNVKHTSGHGNYTFIEGDICNGKVVAAIYRLFRPQYVLHLAAETHVDNSIKDDKEFIRTNVEGTRVLLREGLKSEGWTIEKFVQISTDEVYGSLPLGVEASFREDSPIVPSSSYSASKAAAELLALSYYRTFKFPVVVTRCCNNYGPRQASEKFIPVIIKSILNKQPVPVYGKGMNVREWIYVTDHAEALLKVALMGQLGRVYNIGSRVELTNVGLVTKIIEILKNGQMEFVTDRLGHDLRYAVDSSLARLSFNWEPKVNIDEGLRRTCEWYLKEAQHG